MLLSIWALTAYSPQRLRDADLGGGVGAPAAIGGVGAPAAIGHMQSVLSKFIDARHQILFCNLKIGVKEDVFAKLSEASGQALLGWAWFCLKSHHLLLCCSGVGVVVADACRQLARQHILLAISNINNNNSISVATRHKHSTISTHPHKQPRCRQQHPQ
jgi:hypothetical protein